MAESESPSESPSQSPSESPSESPSFSPSAADVYSNGDILTHQFGNLTGWTDNDVPAGESTQVFFDGKSCLKCFCPTTGDYARRYHNMIGTLTGSRYLLTVRVYFDILGTSYNRAYTYIRGTYSSVPWVLDIQWRTDTCTWQYASGSYSEFEAGTAVDTWHTYTFDIRPDLGTFDVYKNGQHIASGCQLWTGYAGYTDGRLYIGNQCQSVANQTMYVDFVLFGTGEDTSPSAGPDPSSSISPSMSPSPSVSVSPSASPSESPSESPSVSPSNAPGSASRTSMTLYTFP